MSEINWGRLADRMREARHQLIHLERYTGADYEAEILRRTFGFTPAGEPDAVKRVLPYEQVSVPGLMTEAEAKHIRDAHTVVDRMNREAAEKQVAEMRAEVARVYREAAHDLAELIRRKCNDRTVPAKYRREGVLLAADWIDPAVPKDRYGNLLPQSRSG
jgi:hypothetical protein